jgi:hypothetical protein
MSLTKLSLGGNNDVINKLFPPRESLVSDIAAGYGSSNGNASETKANESFDNSVFFDIEAKRTPSLEGKLFSKRSEHIR